MNEDLPTLRLLTLTRLWLFGRSLYSLGPIRLWLPISHRALGYTAAIGVPFWVVLKVLHVPLDGVGLTLHFVVPGMMVWYALRLVGEGARPTDVVLSWVRLCWHLCTHRATLPAWVRGNVRTPLVTRTVRVRDRW